MSLRQVKNALVRVGGRCLRTRPLAWTVQGFYRRRATIVFYHGVWPRGTAALRLFAGTPLDRFGDDLRTMKRFFDLVSLEEILTARPRNSREKPLAAITLDDGFDVINGGAGEVLAECGVSATVFVNTDSVNYRAMMWQHRFIVIQALRGDARFLRGLNRVLEKTGLHGVDAVGEQVWATRKWPASRKDEYAHAVWEACDMPPVMDVLQEHRPYFDWDGLRDWIGRGHGVGFHTRSHPFCSALADDEVQREVIDPVAEVRAKLGLGSMPFAYPFGDRLVPRMERALAERRLFSCLLGTEGLSVCPTDPNRAERVEAEIGIDREVFGWPVVKSLKRTILGGAQAMGLPAGHRR